MMKPYQKELFGARSFEIDEAFCVVQKVFFNLRE